MEWVTYHNIKEFHADTYDFLMAHESCNNLLLSLLIKLNEQRLSSLKTPLMFSLKDQDHVLNCGFQMPHFNLLLPQASEKTFTQVAQGLHGQVSSLPGVSGPIPGSQIFVDEWQKLTHQAPRLLRAQVIYEIKKLNQNLKPSPGSISLASIDDLHRVTEWLLDFGEASDIQGFEANQRLARTMIKERRLFFWVDKDIVAMAAFGGETPNSQRINAVYTAPEYRRLGYGTTLVAELSRLALGMGRRSCFLLTEKLNPSTRSMYENIGYQVLCETQEWKVGESSN